jgi:thioredoxin reductase/nitrite reductase/ring-hydroxylating ferredoxin subunit
MQMSKEAIVFKAHEVQDGDMREVMVKQAKVLVVRLKGRFYAIGAECTHYGGPLIDGALSGRRVVCPWHQAVFDAMTGNLEEPPALDAQPCYEVRVEDGDVIVRVPDVSDNRRTPAMARRDLADGRTFVILGAGAAGHAAAETLRQDGFQGHIVMITGEQHLPYDRPNLSKGYMSGEAGPDTLPWRTAAFYRDHDIEVLLGRPVARVEHPRKTLTFADGGSLAYDALLLATGAVHRHLGVPGESRLSGRGVSYCSTCDGPIFSGKKVVMVGGGDSAVTESLHLKNIGVDVVVVHWLDKLDAQDFLARQLIQSGIPILYNTEVNEILGKTSVEAVTLFNNKTKKTKKLKTAGVFISIGYLPSTDLAEKIGVELTPEGFIRTDQFRTSIPGIYAAGDVTGGYNQIVTASGHGAEAALTIFRDRIQKQKPETA